MSLTDATLCPLRLSIDADREIAVELLWKGSCIRMMRYSNTGGLGLDKKWTRGQIKRNKDGQL